MSSWLAALAITAAICWSRRRRPGARLERWRDPVNAAPNGLAVGGPSAIVPADAAAAWCVAFAVGGVLAAARVPVPVVAGAAVVPVALAWLRRRHLAAKARDDCAAATVEVTFALAGEMRAGRTSAEALKSVAAVAGPLRPAFEMAHAAVAVGEDPAGELARATATPGAERLRYVAAAWAVADSTGGRVAVVLERLSEAMDDDDELRRELDAAMAGPRATMVMLGSLPLLGLVLGQAVGAHPFRLLLHQPLGWGLLAAAATLDGIGVLVTRMIARAALQS